MVAQTVGIAGQSEHIRPFSLTRDLGDLASLIQVSFGEDLAATGSHMVEEMRQMAAIGPLLHLARVTLPPMRGLVYTRNGRLVGNISISHERQKHWVLSNVAVAPDLRGRGIAGRLVDAALAHIRQQGGNVVTLQVRSDNPAALALYAHRGFVVYDTVHELRLSRSSWPIMLRNRDPMLRPPRWSDAPHLRELLSVSMPASARLYRQMVSQQSRIGLWARLRFGWETLSQAHERIALVAAPKGAPVALASVTLRLLASYHELAVHVAPSHRGAVEQALLAALFGQLLSAPRRDMRATVSESHPEALDALWRLRFETQRVLNHMGCILNQS